MNTEFPFCYKYPHPAVTTDMVAFGWDGELKTLLIKRKRPPYEDMWAFPGGFLNPDETLLECVLREFSEETHLTPPLAFEFGSFSSPHRDPRERVISIAFWTAIPWENTQARADDDAKAVAWFPLRGIPVLAFDHEIMLRKAVLSFRDCLLFHPEKLQTSTPLFSAKQQELITNQCQAFLLS